MAESADHLFRCECGGSHFVSVRYWRDEDWPSGYFAIESEYRLDRLGWLERVKLAFKMLRGACTLDEVLLNEADAVRLREALKPLTHAPVAQLESEHLASNE